MTRWAIVADLERCVGCQTCTAACKHANATAPEVQWRRVLDIESGEFPDVRRTFVPVGCMHCADPPCMHVCPSTATGQRQDGIVTIDYDICIGCAYCAVACPYQARFKVDRPRYAYGDPAMENELEREDPARFGVAQKCTYCSDRVDLGLANGLIPGIDPDATPACVNSCIADALHFGDLDDPASNVSGLLDTYEHFAMHEEVGTAPGFFYLTEKAVDGRPLDTGAPETTGGITMKGVEPWLQQHWDARAAGNFMGGGAGAGLFVFAALSAIFAGTALLPLTVGAIGLVGAGLFLVWLEIGRPWRFLNVFRHAQTSWMTREAMMAMPFLGLAAVAGILDAAWLAVPATAFALAFLYCQGKILEASKGIPVWREPRIVPLIVTSGLAEGAGLYLLAAMVFAELQVFSGTVSVVLLALIAGRYLAWRDYRRRLAETGAPSKSLEVFDRMAPHFTILGHVIPIILVAIGLIMLEGPPIAPAIAGALALASGWWFKFDLITRAAYNQGFAIVRAPARGNGPAGPGVKPGWTLPEKVG